MALLFIIITYFIILIKSFEKKNYFRKNFKFFLITIIFIPIFIIVFWPYLWLGAIENLIGRWEHAAKLGVTIFFIVGFFGVFLRNVKRLF